MKSFFFGLILGLALGIGGYMYMQKHPQETEDAKNKVVSSAEKLKDTVKEKVGEVKTEDIKKELERTSVVVRDKAKKAGAAIADAAANAKVTATIKAKYVAEPNLSAFSINVDTTDGVVTLSGTVSNHDQLAKAVQIALDTDGVTKVISTLQVKGNG